MQRANVIVANLVTLTDPTRFDGLAEIIAQARLAAGRIAQTSATLEAMVRENRDTVRRSLAAVHDAAASASAMIDGQVATLVTSAGGLISDLTSFMRGSEGPLRAAIFDLRQATRSLKELAREVRQQPSRLLFSSPPPDRKLP